MFKTKKDPGPKREQKQKEKQQLQLTTIEHCFARHNQNSTSVTFATARILDENKAAPTVDKEADMEHSSKKIENEDYTM